MDQIKSPAVPVLRHREQWWTVMSPLYSGMLGSTADESSKHKRCRWPWGRIPFNIPTTFHMSHWVLGYEEVVTLLPCQRIRSLSVCAKTPSYSNFLWIYSWCGFVPSVQNWFQILQSPPDFLVEPITLTLPSSSNKRTSLYCVHGENKARGTPTTEIRRRHYLSGFKCSHPVKPLVILWLLDLSLQQP